MFKKNQRHLQPALISTVQDLPERQREILETSWAGVFYREFHCRIDEGAFAVMYVDFPSRPNAPVNELVSLEYLKAGNGWTDEEMYEHYLFDVQTRYALGLDRLGDVNFELRTVYNFRQRLSKYMQETGINLLDQAFEQVTDEQIEAYGLKTGKQRMDSTMIASNIRQMGRLQLLVEVLQRTHRMLSEEEQTQYAEVFEAYLVGHAGKYIYRLKTEDYAKHLQGIGRVMQYLLAELKQVHGDDPAYQVLERVFGEHFKVEEAKVQTKEAKELSTASLQSPDDLEATYREKRGVGYQGYVANLTETCDPDNPFQLVTKVQTSPNTTDDSHLLAEALPNLKERTDLEDLYTDGGFGGPDADLALQEQKVKLTQTAIRGRKPDPNKLHLTNFEIEFDQDGQPFKVTCPHKQTVPVLLTPQKKSFVAHFEPLTCQSCPFWEKEQCPAQPGKRDTRHHLRFNMAKAQAADRRRRSQACKREAGNLRAAVEATVRSAKHPFPAGKLPVRGQFRVACMMIGSVALSNVRRIQRYLQAKKRKEKQQNSLSDGVDNSPKSSGVYFWALAKAALRPLRNFAQPPMLCLDW
jgi:hypothetical protein